MKDGVLYVSYDGMLEPLGQSQVLAYLERLAQDRPVHLLSFEKAEDWANVTERHALGTRIAAAGIAWHPLRYHKRPSAIATAWDIAQGTAVGWWLTMRHRLCIVHARSYVPSVMALVIKRLTGASFVFDMRGFWADERIDGGLWPRGGRMYRVAKWFERQFLLNADHVVSLTNAAAREIKSFPYLADHVPPMSVIPTCADLACFKPDGPNPEGFVLGYVGSAGTWYEFDAVVAFFSALRLQKPEARFLIINHNAHAYIRERLVAGGVPLDAVELRAATHAEIPQQMARMHAGIFFYKPSYSRAACAPTKLGEFLGCGLPCISNAGVGDMAGVLEGEHVGVAIRSFDQPALVAGLQALLVLAADPKTRERCVAAANRNFLLDEGIQKYRQIYDSLR